jgi:hypothetical protein
MRRSVCLQHVLPILLLCGFAGALAGCGGGSGDGLDEQGMPMTDEPGDTTDEEPGDTDTPPDDTVEGATLAQLQETIFTPICSQCHTGSNAPQGLRLDSEQTSFDLLVSQPSQQVPDLLRVNPGDPDASYIVRKVEGGPDIVGGQMPLGGTPLNAEQITMLRDWIANGAPRTGTGEMATSMRMESLKPTTEAVVFTAHFSRPLQADTLNASAVQVWFHRGDDRWMASADSYSYRLNHQTLTVSVDQPTTPATAVELLLNDTGTSAVMDVNGRLVDGDGDTTDGGSYSYVYAY